MRLGTHIGGRSWLATGLVLCVAQLALGACAPKAPPTLSAGLADQTRDVRVDDTLAVTASGAVLSRVSLERTDAPGPVPAFTVDATQARLTEPLAPDARYRLVAEAQAQSDAPRAPWQAAEIVTLSLAREFTTVRSPALQPSSQPLVAYRGKPIDLHFSEPLADARLADAPAGARGRIADDPRVFRVEFADLAPGQELALRVVGVRGRNGAPATDQTVAVRTPEGVDLMAVNGAPPSDRVVVPPGAPVALEWNGPLASLRYRVADTPAVWSGTPTTRVNLPLVLDQGQSRTIEIEDATDVEGGWLASPLKLELAAPAPLRIAGIWPADGATKISPQADPTFRFSEPVAARNAVEEAISFDPPVAGRWEWLGPDRVRFLPESGFPRETRITMSVKGGPSGPTGASGSYLPEPAMSTFEVGKLKVIHVWLGQQRLALHEDDDVVFSALVGTGLKGAETPPGTYDVQYKMPVARFRGTNPNGSRYDIPNVKWVLAFYGDYTIHGVHWRSNFGVPASNGCVGLTDANAKIVYDWADVGTRIEIHR